MDQELQRRDFLKKVVIGTNALLLSSYGFNADGAPSLNVPNVLPVAGLIYQNDFSSNMDGISSYATLNLRIDGGLLKFSGTNPNRGIWIGPSYSSGGVQRFLVIKLSNAGQGLKVYTNRSDANSYVQTITSTNEVTISYNTAPTNVDNRVFLSTVAAEYDVAIDYIKIYDGDPSQPQTTSDLWAGTYQQTVNGRLYTWIPSRNANISPQSDGSVVLSAPTTKTSFAGGNTCNRFVFDENYQHLSSSYLSSLFGSGINLPDGHYHYLVHYFNTSNYDTLDAGSWTLAMNPDTYQSNSAAPEAISFSIETTGASVNSQKVTLPVTQERVSWLITNQYLTENLNLPSGKDFGVTRLHWDVVPNNKQASVDAVYTKVTHIQVAGRSDLGTDYNKFWDCVLGTGMTPQQVADSTPLATKFIMMGQLKEQGMSNPQLEQAYSLIYDKMKNQLGITSPNQTKLYNDYFADTDAFGMGSTLSAGNLEQTKLQLSSQSEARKLYSYTNGDGSHPTSLYFSQNCFNYRNRSTGGYLDSYQRIPKGSMVYGHILGYEKSYIAISDRNTICMSWSESEGVNSITTTVGVNYRLKLATGDIIRRNIVGLPFELMKTQSFFSLLLGTSYVLWSNSDNLVKDIATWSAPSNTEFQANGSANPTTWQANNSNYPQPATSPLLVNGRGTSFPGAPMVGEQGAWAGAFLYSKISSATDRVSQSIVYAPFSFTVNGGSSQNGYNGTNNPVTGSLGNAEVSRQGIANAGQHNIINQYYYQKPIVMVTRG